MCLLNHNALQGFKYYVEAEDADILLLTETKVVIRASAVSPMLADNRQVNDPPANPSLKQQYPFAYWSMSNKKSYGEPNIVRADLLL